MRDSSPTPEEWEKLSSKTFNCHIGLGNFEKKNMELSFDFVPAERPGKQLMFYIDPNTLPEDGNPEPFVTGVQRLHWNRFDPVFFDPVNMVALLKVPWGPARHLDQQLTDYCESSLHKVFMVEPDLNNQQPGNLLPIRVSQNGMNFDLAYLDQWMKAIGWDGEPGDPAMSLKAFPKLAKDLSDEQPGLPC